MISTVAPRLDNDSHALPALKRRPRIKPSLRDEEIIRAMRKDVGNDKSCRWGDSRRNAKLDKAERGLSVTIRRIRENPRFPPSQCSMLRLTRPRSHPTLL